MRRTGLALVPVLLAVLTAWWWLPPTAHATADGHQRRPCGVGGSHRENRQMIRCLTNQRGIRVSTSYALRVADCESGFFARADGGSYHGLFQLGRREYRAFSHQGPRWTDREFRRHGYRIYSARGNTLAALAHASRHGWSAWSCP